jgi:hypothetical protein
MAIISDELQLLKLRIEQDARAITEEVWRAVYGVRSAQQMKTPDPCSTLHAVLQPHACNTVKQTQQLSQAHADSKQRPAG